MPLYSIATRAPETIPIGAPSAIPSRTPTTRELIYGNWSTDPETGVEYPGEVTMKRYIRTGIDERSPERLTEEVTVRITDFAANY